MAHLYRPKFVLKAKQVHWQNWQGTCLARPVLNNFNDDVNRMRVFRTWREPKVPYGCHTYHHTAGEGNATAAVSVGDYVTVADTEERYSSQPHWV